VTCGINGTTLYHGCGPDANDGGVSGPSTKLIKVEHLQKSLDGS